MNKKLLIYGLAFGSAAAALSYMYLSLSVYTKSSGLQFFFVFSEALLIPGIGIFLFLKSFKQSHLNEFTLGRAVFMSFILSVIIASAVSLVYSYIIQFKPELIAKIVDYKNNLIATSAKKLNKPQVEIDKALKNITFAHSSRAQFMNQLFLGASRGLFFGAIIAYLMKAKVNKD